MDDAFHPPAKARGFLAMELKFKEMILNIFIVTIN